MKFWSVTIQMEGTELSLNAVLFGTLYEVVLMFESVDEILKCDHSSVTIQYFPVVWFIILYKLVRIFF